MSSSHRQRTFSRRASELAEGKQARITGLRDEGRAIMEVSHHLEEMFEIGDRVTILCDGCLVTTAPMAQFDHDSLIGSMVGRARSSRSCTPPPTDRTIGDVRLRFAGLRPPAFRTPISFEVRSGEILGIAGLLGPGRSELLRAILGADGCEADDPRRPRAAEVRRSAARGAGGRAC